MARGGPPAPGTGRHPILHAHAKLVAPPSLSQIPENVLQDVVRKTGDRHRGLDGHLLARTLTTRRIHQLCGLGSVLHVLEHLFNASCVPWRGVGALKPCRAQVGGRPEFLAARTVRVCRTQQSSMWCSIFSIHVSLSHSCIHLQGHVRSIDLQALPPTEIRDCRATCRVACRESQDRATHASLVHQANDN